MLAFETIIA